MSRGMNVRNVVCVVLATIGLLVSSALADPIPVSTLSEGPVGTFTASASDLVNDDQDTFSSISTVGSPLYGSSAANLIDGSVYGGSDNECTENGLAVDSTGNVVVTITLDTTTNALGYDIYSVGSYASFSTYPRCARQNYDVAFSLVGSSAFTDAFSVENMGGSSEYLESRIVTEDMNDGPLGTGVDQIQVTFKGNNVDDGLVVYRELDVFGSATVPEPGTLVVLVTGLLGLVCYAWRKRK